MSKWYGNLTNRLMENTSSTEPKIGMGATELMYSDREPWEIIDIKYNRKGEARQLVLRHMSSKAKPGAEFGHQDWIIEPDPNGEVRVIKRKRNGTWGSFLIGHVEKYYDWSF